MLEGLPLTQVPQRCVTQDILFFPLLPFSNLPFLDILKNNLPIGFYLHPTIFFARIPNFINEAVVSRRTI